MTSVPLPKVEITEIPPLDPEEQSLLDFHSIVNITNVLRCELVVMGDLIGGDIDLLSGGLKLCEQLLAGLSNHKEGLKQAARIDDFEQAIMEDINSHLGSSKVPPAQLADSLTNIASVFAVFKTRAREILARAGHPMEWRTYEIAEIRDSLLVFFSAMEKNSHGRYRIRTNPALQSEQDYYADLRFESPLEKVRLPPVFLDVTRDLVANARKYTKPGGQITAALHQDDSGTSFVVRDTGCGIPPDELGQVVHFGKRASNVLSHRTQGGGFGLTKAFFVTKQFGGRFWIASRLGHGTEVRIWLPPAPSALQVA